MHWHILRMLYLKAIGTRNKIKSIFEKKYRVFDTQVKKYLRFFRILNSLKTLFVRAWRCGCVPVSYIFYDIYYNCVCTMLARLATGVCVYLRKYYYYNCICVKQTSASNPPPLILPVHVDAGRKSVVGDRRWSIL